MEVGQDARTEQHLILSELREAATQVQRSALPANAEALLSALTLALNDGLRCPDDGFWPAVSVAVHAETRRIVEKTSSPRRRGRAWLRVALAESSLGSHLRLLSREASVRRAYKPGAALTTRATQLATLCDNLPDLSLALANASHASVSVPTLPSPVDSGVAMTDSDREDDRRCLGDRDDDCRCLGDSKDDRRCLGDRGEVVATVLTRRPKRRRCKAKRVSFHDEQSTESTTESTMESSSESLTESLPESAAESDCTKALDEREERCDPEGQEDPARVDGATREGQVRVDGAGRAGQCKVDGRVPVMQKDKQVRVSVSAVPPKVRVDVSVLRAKLLGNRPSRWGLCARPNAMVVVATGDAGTQRLDQLVEREIREAVDGGRTSASVETEPSARLAGLLGLGETVYKTFRLHRCSAAPSQLCRPIGPVLLVLTNHRLCLCESTNHETVELTRLSAMTLLPWAQGLLLASQTHETMLLATGDELRTNELAAAVTMATLRATGRFLPVGSVSTATRVGEDRLSEELIDRVWLVAVDNGDSDAECRRKTPLGPTLQGCLMVQSGPGASWAPRHLTLKAGVLYEFDAESSRLPSRWHALATLTRCQRTSAVSRPHAFVLRWGSNAELRLAAADERQASDWLDAIVAAANTTEWGTEAQGAGPGWLWLTNQGRLLQADTPWSRHGCETAALGHVATLHSLRFAEDRSQCCQLEWDCREAGQEPACDWLLHFASANQTQAFVSAVSSHWQRHHGCDLAITEMETNATERCQEARFLLLTAWE